MLGLLTIAQAAANHQNLPRKNELGANTDLDANADLREMIMGILQAKVHKKGDKAELTEQILKALHHHNKGHEQNGCRISANQNAQAAVAKPTPTPTTTPRAPAAAETKTPAPTTTPSGTPPAPAAAGNPTPTPTHTPTPDAVAPAAKNTPMQQAPAGAAGSAMLHNELFNLKVVVHDQRPCSSRSSRSVADNYSESVADHHQHHDVAASSDTTG
ncbi:hypothetical protein P8C59_002865 [Phyllachora maydis]|uniref:Uncharacterized protein n=1 Tax=Phyllachora maydis TaxID=1825666 RepID=A0AAD9HZ10_9PEZI|nr:hypothetical protein P8C59_002865 [Phyllachora maydis]